MLYDGSIQFTPGVSERNGVGQDRYYNDGALGSLTDMTDLNGNFLSQRKWDAYGNQTTTPSSYFRGWNEGAGYEEDSGSGLRLLGYRFYDPSVGRFLTQDPAGFGSNWYCYCGNAPLAEVDPQGLFADGASGLIVRALPFPWFKSYDNEDDAAVAAMDFIWPRSWQEHREYGGWVVRRKADKRFVLIGFYRAPDDGKGGVGPNSLVPSRVAFWHTHPFLGGTPHPNFPGNTVGNPDWFSNGSPNSSQDGDIPHFRLWQVDGYLRSPRYVKKWRYGSRDLDEGIVVKAYGGP